MAKKKPRKNTGYTVRLPNESKGPLEARSKVTGRPVSTEIMIAVIRHLSMKPEAEPVLKFPDDLPTGHKPPDEGADD